MAKYTPGPWEIHHRLNVAKGNRGIANCGGYSDNNNQEQAQDENEANVRLIAAAPDLLEACESMLAVLDTLWTPDAPTVADIDELILWMTDIIAAAKGEADND